MSLLVHVDVGHRPELNTDALWQIVQNGLGDRHEIVKQGRWYQVPNVIVKRSDTDGAAIQILQQRLRHRTVPRVYAVAPSVAKRPSTPYGMRQQITRSQPLVDEVVAFLRGCSALHDQPDVASDP